mmetsp:Transcript_3897/g.9223  ORF Transcript_3897/g.9223 Transcript_3897/m.9223 type:complete len:554 (-) Transcript_3897:8098-9759(-)
MAIFSVFRTRLVRPLTRSSVCVVCSWIVAIFDSARFISRAAAASSSCFCKVFSTKSAAFSPAAPILSNSRCSLASLLMAASSASSATLRRCSSRSLLKLASASSAASIRRTSDLTKLSSFSSCFWMERSSACSASVSTRELIFLTALSSRAAARLAVSSTFSTDFSLSMSLSSRVTVPASRLAARRFSSVVFSLRDSTRRVCLSCLLASSVAISRTVRCSSRCTERSRFAWLRVVSTTLLSSFCAVSLTRSAAERVVVSAEELSERTASLVVEASSRALARLRAASAPASSDTSSTALATPLGLSGWETRWIFVIFLNSASSFASAALNSAFTSSSCVVVSGTVSLSSMPRPPLRFSRDSDASISAVFTSELTSVFISVMEISTRVTLTLYSSFTTTICAVIWFALARSPLALASRSSLRSCSMSSSSFFFKSRRGFIAASLAASILSVTTFLAASYLAWSLARAERMGCSAASSNFCTSTRTLFVISRIFACASARYFWRCSSSFCLAKNRASFTTKTTLSPTASLILIMADLARSPYLSLSSSIFCWAVCR